MLDIINYITEQHIDSSTLTELSSLMDNFFQGERYFYNSYERTLRDIVEKRYLHNVRVEEGNRVLSREEVLNIVQQQIGDLNYIINNSRFYIENITLKTCKINMYDKSPVVLYTIYMDFPFKIRGRTALKIENATPTPLDARGMRRLISESLVGYLYDFIVKDIKPFMWIRELFD